MKWGFVVQIGSKKIDPFAQKNFWSVGFGQPGVGCLFPYLYLNDFFNYSTKSGLTHRAFWAEVKKSLKF
jgi:hypothetical protein